MITSDPNGNFCRRRSILTARQCELCFSLKLAMRKERRAAEEYVKPLLMLSGKEYEETGFSDLIVRIESALDTKYGKRPGAIYIGPDGTEKRLY